MTPIDTLIAAVQELTISAFGLALSHKEAGILRATFEQVLADMQHATDHWHAHYDAAVLNWNECLRRMEEAEAVSNRLREALKEALDEWQDSSAYKGDYLAHKHGDVVRIVELRKLLK